MFKKTKVFVKEIDRETRDIIIAEHDGFEVEFDSLLAVFKRDDGMWMVIDTPTCMFIAYAKTRKEAVSKAKDCHIKVEITRTTDTYRRCRDEISKLKALCEHVEV